MTKLLKKFEYYIVVSLLVLLTLVVLVGTIELIVILFQKFLSPPIVFLNIDEFLDLFGFFLIILIGIELIEATKVYLQEEVIHVEVIFLVAIIAMARKAIVLDIKESEPLTVFGLAAIILSLSLGYFFLKKALKETR